MHKQSVIQDRGCEYIAKICVTLQMRLVLYSSLNMFASKNHSHWPCKKLITVYTVTYDNSSEQEGGGGEVVAVKHFFDDEWVNQHVGFRWFLILKIHKQKNNVNKMNKFQRHMISEWERSETKLKKIRKKTSNEYG